MGGQLDRAQGRGGYLAHRHLVLPEIEPNGFAKGKFCKHCFHGREVVRGQGLESL